MKKVKINKKYQYQSHHRKRNSLLVFTICTYIQNTIFINEMWFKWCVYIGPGNNPYDIKKRLFGITFSFLNVRLSEELLAQYLTPNLED